MTERSCDVESKSGTLSIAADLTIHHVLELKKRLLEALVESEEMIVDVSAVGEVDVAGLQLLCACQREAFDCGKKMRLRVGANARFVHFLAKVGFSRSFTCDHGDDCKCLWTSSH